MKIVNRYMKKRKYDKNEMEAISSLGPEKFIKNYNSMKFKCTKKEYHEKTKYIKYMLFEQITN